MKFLDQLAGAGPWTTSAISMRAYLCLLLKGTAIVSDIITTGTPPGVGMGMKPPQYLKPGDKMRICVDGLGEQNQKVVRDK
jgi:Fumarylacetoacetate (FAA) hydrolase family